MTGRGRENRYTPCMRRRLLTLSLVALTLVPAALAFAAPAASPCACTQSACCCAGKGRAASMPCHGSRSDSDRTRMRCRHDAAAWLAAAVRDLPRPAATPAIVWSAAGAAPAAPAAAPCEGFVGHESPPPRFLRFVA